MVTPSRRWSASPRPGSPFRDEHTETWGVLEVEAGPYGPQKPRRVLVATTDPRTLPTLSTWYLITNLPAPSTAQAVQSTLAGADAAEIVRLYGLRQWVEQCYKQTKYALGWSEYQVRSDLAMRRHWALVCCAFAFCWYNQSQQGPAPAPVAVEHDSGPVAEGPSPAPTPAPRMEAGRGENQQHRAAPAAAAVLAGGLAGGARVAGAVDHAVALLARVVGAAPTTSAARVA